LKSAFSGGTDAGTLPAALEQAARRAPHRGIGIFDGRGRRVERLLYPEILDLARLGARRHAALGVTPGEPVLVCLPSSWEWMEAWLGALLRGALPVAVAPPGAMGASEAHVRKLAALAERLGARHVFSTPAVGREAETLGLDGLTAILRTPGELAAAAPVGAVPGGDRGALATPSTDDLAFLQLTSGSTGLPRAVMIPHGAVLHNNHASDLAIGAPHGRPTHQWAESMVSWLPLNHDMGLVGCFFLSLNLGLDLWLFNPTTFLARPKLWLEQLAQRGPTFAPAPNFGYQLCTERLKAGDLEGLDLSGWRGAMTGAEMVRPETAAAFAELTAAAHFAPEAFRPCYGLAEGTLAVTFDLKGQGVRTLPLPEGADTGLGLKAVVSTGPPIPDTEVRIVAPEGSALPEGAIGEVRARGPGIFRGYYNDAAATAEGLRDGWLCTGDLGFLKDGELYLTGRIKDVLILRGHNLMPHELEWLAEEVTGGGGAQRTGAFSIARGSEGEEAVVVAETTEKDPQALAALAHDIRQRVGRTLSLTLADVAFVRRGKIPKTTSGKVQRRQLRQMYLDGELERLDA
jgi:fatty-acyl-CoA synthase